MISALDYKAVSDLFAVMETAMKERDFQKAMESLKAADLILVAYQEKEAKNVLMFVAPTKT